MTQQFIELKPLIIRISIFRLFLKPIAALWRNAQPDGEVGLFILLILNFFLASPTPPYLSCFFFPPPLFFPEKICSTNEEERKILRNRWEGIEQWLLGSGWGHTWCVTDPKLKTAFKGKVKDQFPQFLSTAVSEEVLMDFQYVGVPVSWGTMVNTALLCIFHDDLWSDCPSP